MGLTGQFEDAIEEQQAAQTLNEEQVRPLIQRAGDMSAVSDVGLKFFALPRVPGQPLESAATVTVPTGVDLLNAVARKRDYLDVSIGEMNRLRETFAEIRRKIAAEVGSEIAEDAAPDTR
jgi:hypothetical protein